MRTNKTTWLLAAGVLVAGVGAALWSNGTVAPPAATPDAAVAPNEMPADHPATSTPAPNGGGLSGTVAEIIQVDSYTYLRLTRAGGEDFWAAVPKTTIAEGQKVSIADATLMNGFESKSLGRRFDQIYFGTLGSSSAQPGLPADHPPTAETNPHGAENGAPHQTPGATVAEGDIARAEGGLTIAEIYAQAPKHEGEKVKVAGRITKVTPGVLGKTWLHVQDGSGDPGQGTHDLVVTTQLVPAVGDTVVLTGTLVRDKDLGGGYRYDVLVEDATVETVN